MQDVITYILIIALVVLSSYVMVELFVLILQVIFGNQSALIASPLP